MNQLLKAWKRRLRRMRRLRHRARVLPRASVVFISPAKCGRTWVRAMMSHGYHEPCGTPIDALVDEDTFNAIDARIPVFFFTHLSKESSSLKRQLDPARLVGKTVIGMVRDPRDAAVSRYYHERHRNRRYDVDPASADDGRMLFRFLIQGRYGLAFYIDSLNQLRRFVDGHGDFHLFSYETFRRDTAGELARLMAAIGTPLDEEAINSAVEFAAFENMRRREAEGFFQTAKLRPGDPDEPDSFKVRRGKVGGYRDELAPDEVAALDRLVDERLLPGFGYRSDEAGAALLDRPSVAAGRPVTMTAAGL